MDNESTPKRMMAIVSNSLYVEFKKKILLEGITQERAIAQLIKLYVNGKFDLGKDTDGNV